MRFLLIIGLLAISLCRCAENEQSVTDTSISFEEFYQQFLTDSGFQLAHIEFPLAGLPPNPDLEVNDFRWQKADWQIQQIIDPETTGFRSRFERVSDGFVIEIILHKSGKYAMERRFARLSGNEWMLIYYAALHPVETAQN